MAEKSYTYYYSGDMIMVIFDIIHTEDKQGIGRARPLYVGPAKGDYEETGKR